MPQYVTDQHSLRSKRVCNSCLCQIQPITLPGHVTVQLTQSQHSQFWHFGCQSTLISTNEFIPAIRVWSALDTKPVGTPSLQPSRWHRKDHERILLAVHMLSCPQWEKCAQVAQEKRHRTDTWFCQRRNVTPSLRPSEIYSLSLFHIMFSRSVPST